MTFVVNESCIRCKIMDCVDVCPVELLLMPGRIWPTFRFRNFREALTFLPNIRELTRF